MNRMWFGLFALAVLAPGAASGQSSLSGKARVIAGDLIGLNGKLVRQAGISHPIQPRPAGGRTSPGLAGGKA